MSNNSMIIRRPFLNENNNKELVIEFNDSFESFVDMFPIKLDDKCTAIYMEELPNYKDVPNNSSILERDDFRKLKKGMLLKIGEYVFTFK